MNGTDTLARIDEIAATSSKNEKQALVGKYLESDPLFAKAIYLAQNPFITFGIKKLPDWVIVIDDKVELTENSDCWGVLAALAARELTGKNAARAIVTALSPLNQPSRELLKRVLLKDLRAGFSRSTVNKAKPGFIPSFDCMLAHKYEEKRIKNWPVAVEPKIDGVRVLAFISKDEVKFYSRSGKEYTTFNHLVEPLLRVNDCVVNNSVGYVLDGEVVSGSFNKTVGDVRRKDEQATDAKFCVFDCISVDLFSAPKGNETKETYKQRRAEVEELVKCIDRENVVILPQRLANNHDEVIALYNEYRSNGYEGAVVKPLEGTYQRKRSHNWLKIKDEITFDVRILRVFEGTGKYVGMAGGVYVDFEGVEVSVGGGFSDKQRADFWNLQSEVIGRLIEVAAHEVTPDGSLRHPRFIRFRDDKDDNA